MEEILRQYVNLEFYVAGLRFHQYKEVFEDIKVDDEVQLIREPHNQFDKYAVRIDYNGTILGYVPAKTGASALVSKALENGAKLQAKVTKNDPTKEEWKTLKVWIKNKGGELDG